jgi:Holliday junction DNA helicase RuvB
MTSRLVDVDEVAPIPNASQADALGLDEMDRRLLRVLVENFNGGPAGLETLAAALAEPKDTIEDVYEPFLLRQGLLMRTPRGRQATLKAYTHLGVPPPAGPGNTQGTLFGEAGHRSDGVRDDP